MNTDIRFLQQLEDDLTEAAARETAVLAGAADDEISIHRSRRLPRRERHWGAIAAGLVAFLVLAGSIGFLTQRPGAGARDVGGLLRGRRRRRRQRSRRARGAGLVPRRSAAPRPTQGDASRPSSGGGAGAGTASAQRRWRSRA